MRVEVIVHRAAANLPQSTQSPIFTVGGGRVMLMALVPEVTTAIQNQANATSVKANPTVGSDATIWTIGSIEDRSVGTIFGVDSSGAGVEGTSAPAFPAGPVVIPAGTIDLSCAASSTGQIKWVLGYMPLDDGAYVAVA